MDRKRFGAIWPIGLDLLSCQTWPTRTLCTGSTPPTWANKREVCGWAVYNSCPVYYLCYYCSFWTRLPGSRVSFDCRKPWLSDVGNRGCRILETVRPDRESILASFLCREGNRTRCRWHSSKWATVFRESVGFFLVLCCRCCCFERRRLCWFRGERRRRKKKKRRKHSEM